MKYTLALETDQEHRIAEAENALTERINHETNLIAEGEFDPTFRTSSCSILFYKGKTTLNLSLNQA